MKKIYINGRFLTQPITGVQRYSRELLGALDEMIDTGEIDARNHEIICLVPKSLQVFPAWKHIQLKPVGILDGNFWEQFVLPFFVKDGILFSPANIGPYFVKGQIVTMHDASVFAVPDAYSWSFRLKYRIILKHLGKTAKKIITVSEFSKKELIKYCKIDPEKIVVIPHGHEHLLRIKPDPAIISKYGLDQKPYYLVVGSNSPHKNLRVVFEAIKLINNPEFNLVIAGGSYDRVFSKQAVDLPKNVIHVGYVTDSELRSLYEHAQAFIFPSKYEGFGLPILEALSVGCPVISSNAASLPEVGGDIVTYFDSDDTKGLANAINNFSIIDQIGRRDLFDLKFKWYKCTSETWNIIRNNNRQFLNVSN